MERASSRVSRTRCLDQAPSALNSSSPFRDSSLLRFFRRTQSASAPSHRSQNPSRSKWQKELTSSPLMTPLIGLGRCRSYPQSPIPSPNHPQKTSTPPTQPIEVQTRNEACHRRNMLSSCNNRVSIFGIEFVGAIYVEMGMESWYVKDSVFGSYIGQRQVYCG